MTTIPTHCQQHPGPAARPTRPGTRSGQPTAKPGGLPAFAVGYLGLALGLVRSSQLAARPT